MKTVEDFALASLGAHWSGEVARYRMKVAQFQADVLRARLEAETAMYVMSAGAPKPKTSKCPACGSREFRTHHKTTICAYCRCAA